MSYSLIKPVDRRRDDAVFTGGRLLLLPHRHDEASKAIFRNVSHRNRDPTAPGRPRTEAITSGKQ